MNCMMGLNICEGWDERLKDGGTPSPFGHLPGGKPTGPAPGIPALLPVLWASLARAPLHGVMGAIVLLPPSRENSS